MKAKQYINLTKISIKNNIAYLKSFIISKFFLIFIIIIMYNLYSVMLGSNRNFRGFTIPMLLIYITITETIEISKVRIHQTISQEIKNGSCAYTLIRPISYIGYHFFNSLGEILINAIITISLGILISFCINNNSIKYLNKFLFIIPPLFLSITLNWIIMFIIGLFAFSMEDSTPIYWIYQKFIFILGGMFFPIDFFPNWLQDIARYLPTTYIQYFTASLVKSFTVNYYLKGLTYQLILLALLFIVAKLLYKKGIANLQVNGG